MERLPGTKKVFPSINLLDKVSLYAWKEMRNMTKNYGKAFYMRQE